MDAEQHDRIVLAAKCWRDTEKQILATKDAPLPDVDARSAHHFAKVELRRAVDAALKSGAQP